ncbi:hypothetical protein C942_04728 [Photobacterium marinum]|uniref:Uncharacterized protein n=1 Tax=Photobacterium marinum TaxID=1056511 RepID=L8J625_9GAMM|nr:hypothetical protein C942_04728 [Photobacterium marinum]
MPKPPSVTRHLDAFVMPTELKIALILLKATMVSGEKQPTLTL